ncbi:MAG: zinc ribbon domain-containing protein [Phycisphaerae bacterium]|nr:zinc ribbon domain-containing protein [Phycisphaerae bacterium]
MSSPDTSPDAHIAGDDLTFAGNLPPGNHPLEIAARAGFGPLSEHVHEAWHGGAVPCVTCGQLVRRGSTTCEHCGQDLRPEMLDRMRAHAGPWYVLEHVRPFPGVSLERIVRQIRRGLISETSIVRGPATDHQWRFAVETPGLSRYFNRCWKCHDSVSPGDTYCRNCRAYLLFEQPKWEFQGVPTAVRSTPGGQARSPGAIAGETGHLQGLRAALDESPSPQEELGSSSDTGRSKRRQSLGFAPTFWVVAVLSAVAIMLLLLIVQILEGRKAAPAPASRSPDVPLSTPATEPPAGFTQTPEPATTGD